MAKTRLGTRLLATALLLAPALALAPGAAAYTPNPFDDLWPRGPPIPGWPPVGYGGWVDDYCGNGTPIPPFPPLARYLGLSSARAFDPGALGKVAVGAACAAL